MNLKSVFGGWHSFRVSYLTLKLPLISYGDKIFSVRGDAARLHGFEAHGLGGFNPNPGGFGGGRSLYGSRARYINKKCGI